MLPAAPEMKTHTLSHTHHTHTHTLTHTHIHKLTHIPAASEIIAI